ncbi:MAG: ribonuclease III [Planctomycetes bacterium GWF2_50_10]|nr:MAG: ribonuclease III [Planctomycetes bacterium GWF2_50_10]
MDKFEQVEQLLSYHFKNKAILIEALTHSSQADHRLLSNERLEFLGDAVLSLVVCQALYEKFPTYLEGDLTKIKSMMVSRKTCSRLAGKMGLEGYLKIGKGMANSAALSGSLAACALESIIAAVYLDGGFEAAREFILKVFGPLIENADAQSHQENFKSLLQQHAQQELNLTPIYELLDEKGPDHNKCFESAVMMGDKRFPSAWGTNKKEAEQKAAYAALVELGVLEPIEADI